MSMFSVAGQVVWASGASRGIGRALAEGFVKEGATVVISGREAGTLEATARELSTGENRVHFRVCDVSREESIAECAASIVAEFGRIDTLLNIAGVNNRKRVETYTPAEYDFIVDINLRGAFLVAQAVGRHMISRKSGAIVNIDSLNSHAPLKGVLPYAMSKAGVYTMTRGLALEWAEHGVRVNGLAPGFILTDLTKKLWSDPTMQGWAQANTPMRRLGVPEDLVGTAIFLASPAATFLTGQTLYVDGGFTAGVSWPIPLA